MKKVNKRRIKKRRVLLLAAMLVLVICLIVTATYVGIEASVQSYRHQTVSELLEERNAFLNQVNKLQNTGNITDTSFESLRSLAKNDNAQAYSILTEYDGDEKIDEETFNEILKLEPDQDGQEYLEIMKNAYQIPQLYIDFLLKDPDRLDFVLAYTSQDQYQTPPAALDVSLDTVPQLIQWDLKWGYIPYGDVNICIGGCAPTSLAMVYSYLLQDPSITPAVMAAWSDAHGMYVPDAGTSHAFMVDSAAEYGLQVQQIPVDAETVKTALANGQILVASVVPGDFTTTGHILVIAGLEGDKLIINDPNSIKNSNKKWDINTVLNQTAALWAYSI